MGTARFDVETDARLDVSDVTDRVADAVDDAAGTDADACTVFVRHTTAGVVCNENERRLLSDIEELLASAVPDEGWSHDELDGNADSHLRALLLGNSVTVPLADGELDLGTWQSLLLVECDGPRTRTVSVVTH
ncbi:secondary thiamine-phosphate synthase enzyme YjbQ [Halopelagius longus]|uniref:Secondary thiamine-phosphate synthase enzyme n=1 Tax=Halopelagius longus TaxID=1236180 RepID=A0A1H1B995_9EURY|nr:secondary thiamine-phosphate synthase enzyme YjbQ [Halopelagius longus]RDI70693.1 YjbQ family protein [Halopelagius longus]SDQ48460.1 secondary thiamine-phosphate synthase enzyme [Halopelagius longus]